MKNPYFRQSHDYPAERSFSARSNAIYQKGITQRTKDYAYRYPGNNHGFRLFWSPRLVLTRWFINVDSIRLR